MKNHFWKWPEIFGHFWKWPKIFPENLRPFLEMAEDFSRKSLAISGNGRRFFWKFCDFWLCRNLRPNPDFAKDSTCQFAFLTSFAFPYSRIREKSCRNSKSIFGIFGLIRIRPEIQHADFACRIFGFFRKILKIIFGRFRKKLQICVRPFPEMAEDFPEKSSAISRHG